MSRHEVADSRFTWVFGWDQPLMSFYLQKHDRTLDEDENPVVWLGTAGSAMYEVEDLVQVAAKHGLEIDHETKVQLFREQDDGI